MLRRELLVILFTILFRSLHRFVAVKLVDWLFSFQIEFLPFQTWVVERIAVYAEDSIQTTKTVAAVGVEWVDVFPDDFLVRRHFKEAASGALVDQRVAVVQTLSAGNIGGIEIDRIVCAILPNRLFSFRIDFKNTTEIWWEYCRAAIWICNVITAIIENKDIAIFQFCWIVWERNLFTWLVTIAPVRLFFPYDSKCRSCSCYS